MRNGRPLGLAGVLGLVASMMLAGPAAATPAQPEGARADAGSEVGSVAGGVAVEQLDAVDREAAGDYWTPRRLAAARPVLLEQIVDRAGEVVSSTLGLLEPVGLGGLGADPLLGLTGAEDAAGSRAPGQDPAESPHVGKVFFSTSAGDFVCSGNLVESTNGSTVTTAGHCVVDDGAFVDHLVFAPAYEDGSAPYGLWAAEELATTAGWAESGDIEKDVGFAVLETRDGRSAADVVGDASPIVFDRPRGLSFSSYGYPATSPYDGETLHRCQDQAQQDPFGSSTRGISCDMGRGSSGGPWFIGEGADGAQNSVNSYSYLTDPDTMYGPYFGPAIEEVYTYAASR